MPCPPPLLYIRAVPSPLSGWTGGGLIGGGTTSMSGLVDLELVTAVGVLECTCVRFGAMQQHQNSAEISSTPRRTPTTINAVTAVSLPSRGLAALPPLAVVSWGAIEVAVKGLRGSFVFVPRRMVVYLVLPSRVIVRVT